MNSMMSWICSKKRVKATVNAATKKIMAEAVLLLLFRLDFISTTVLIIFGMVLGHILSNVF